MNELRHLRRYIERVMPLERLCALFCEPQWLVFREFCFVTENYQRYLSFRTPDELRSEALRRLRFLRELHIGAEYYAPCVQRSAIPLQPHLQELVLDIDATDYAALRSCGCGTEKRVCARCWCFLASALCFLDWRLRTEFGFRKLLWEFSGRRGLHCWVFDHEVRLCSERERERLVSALVDQFAPGLEGDFERALELGAVDYASLQTLLSEAVHQCVERVEDALALLDSRPQYGELPPAVRAALAWQVMRPRLDCAVSRKLGHLMRMPCSWHPETGNVCVPLHPSTVWRFELDKVPNLRTGQHFDRLPALFSSFLPE
jgi:DNA primase small subunit